MAFSCTKRKKDPAQKQSHMKTQNQKARNRGFVTALKKGLARGAVVDLTFPARMSATNSPTFAGPASSPAVGVLPFRMGSAAPCIVRPEASASQLAS
jgi:hypothetical protein